MKPYITYYVGFLVLLSLPLVGQTWAEEGTKWTFHQLNNQGKLITSTVWVNGDTTIGGVAAKWLKVEDLRDYSLPEMEDEYTRLDSGKVYMWKADQWCLLYDFNAEIGDTYEVTCHEEGVTNPGIVVEVIAKGEYNQQPTGENEFYQEVKTDDTRYSADGFIGYTTGNWKRFLPTQKGNKPKHGPWRCLEQESRELINFTLFKIGEQPHCDLRTSTRKISEEQMQIEPNPTRGIVFLRNWRPGMEVILSNLSGQEISRTKSNYVSTSGLARGTYVLRATSQDLMLVGKIIKR